MKRSPTEFFDLLMLLICTPLILYLIWLFISLVYLGDAHACLQTSCP